MQRRRKIRDEADARACLEAARAAGGDRVAWSRARGIDARSLNAWRINLGRTRSKKRGPAGGGLVELVPTSSSSNARYVVDLGGIRIEVDDEFNSDTLQRVVQALRAC